MKIAVCGTASTSLGIANTFDNSWQIYSCNGAFLHLNRFDLHFELHDIDYLKNTVKPDPSYFQFLKDIGNKAVLNRKHPDFPEAQVYPIQAVCDFIGAQYFNNTIAYMIAYAMYSNGQIVTPEGLLIQSEPLTDIAIVGVDMASDSEYAHQRPCCEFYLGIAKGKGIEIHLPGVCPLLNSSHLYGFEREPAFMVSSKQKLNDLKPLLKKTEDEKRLAEQNHTYTKAMTELLEKIIKIHQ